jgi:NitT/TauT family transport system substrate-binding protein
MTRPANNDKVRAAIGKYIKLPPEVLAKAQINPPGPVVTDKQLAYWLGLMREQEMLKGSLQPASLIFK